MLPGVEVMLIVLLFLGLVGCLPHADTNRARMDKVSNKIFFKGFSGK